MTVSKHLYETALESR